MKELSSVLKKAAAVSSMKKKLGKKDENIEYNISNPKIGKTTYIKSEKPASEVMPEESQDMEMDEMLKDLQSEESDVEEVKRKYKKLLEG